MDVGERREENGSLGSRRGKDGRQKGREKEMISKHMNNPLVLITFLHMCSFVCLCSTVSIASFLLQNLLPKMHSLLLWHSQCNDAVMHHFNVADKLQHVNSVCATGLPPALGWWGKIHKIFTEWLSEASDCRAACPLCPNDSRGICLYANGCV